MTGWIADANVRSRSGGSAVSAEWSRPPTASGTVLWGCAKVLRSCPPGPVSQAWSCLCCLWPPVLRRPFVALVLGHATPPAAGWVVALSSALVVLAVDALDKRIRAGRPRPDHQR